MKGCVICGCDFSPARKRHVCHESIYPHNMTREQWRKWVACEAMKGMLSYSDNRVEDLKFIPKDAFDYADAFLKEGDKDE